MTDEMDEIWALYADDGAQALNAAEEALEALDADDGEQASHVGALFRAVHTFKGNSRVLGLAQVEGMAHLAEDLIGLVRDEGVPFSKDIGNALIQTTDVLRTMLEDTADTREDVDPAPSAPLKEELRQLIAKLTSNDSSEDEAHPEAEKSGDDASEADEPADRSPDLEPEQTGNVNKAPRATSKKSEEPRVETPAQEGLGESDEAPKAKDAAPKPTPTLDPSFAGLLDQLDGGDGADFDAFEDDGDMDEDIDQEPLSFEDDEPAFQDEKLPEPVAEPEPEQPQSGTEILAEITDGKVIAVDPVHKQIFADMVAKVLAELDEMIADWNEDTAPDAARSQADGLRYAANQLSLEQWSAPLDAYLAGEKPDQQATQELKETLQKQAAQDFGDAATAQETDAKDEVAGSGRAFFEAMSKLYPQVADIGVRIRSDAPPSPQERQELSKEICALADPLGYVRVSDAATTLSTVPQGKGYRAAELAFYEELVHIERALETTVFDSEVIAPSKLLGAWCTDHIFQTLQNLRAGLEQRNRSQDGVWFPEFETLMRRVHFACLNIPIDTASQLSMALIDLFARVRSDNDAPDVILIQMARGYVDTMELVFDALDQGDTPDTSVIEKMFEEASTICFVASGMVTAKSIEARLGLPPEFHRVLSPESVRTAQAAIDAGLHFYVLRADLNEDDDLAQGFLECITSGVVQMVTNVTVFLEQRTLFDFLVASSLPQDRMIEQLALLDPTEVRLSVIHSLEVADLPDDHERGEGFENEVDSLDSLQLGNGGDNAGLLEAVGAISASHALLEHELSQLASVDLVQDITVALRNAGLGELDVKVRALLRDKLDNHTQRLTEISESGSQLAEELSHLQQESVAQRSRPAEALLRPFRAHVAAQSAKLGTPASVSYVGGDVVLDQLLIVELRQLLKSLAAARLLAAHPPTRFHIGIEAESDHIRVTVTDNSPTEMNPSDLSEMTNEVRRKKGSLRGVVLPAGAGMRYHLRLPQKMIVLDGMVVRAGKVRYVLPVDAIQRILQTDQVVSVSAGGAAQMLKVDDGGLVPIQGLAQGYSVNTDGTQLFVLVRSGGVPFAVPVDELLGQQLVLLRPLQGVLSSVRDMSGIAILSGGEVGMVVAVSSMAPVHKDAA